MDLEAVYDEAEEGEDEASPGSEVEELASACLSPRPAWGHANPGTEINDLENLSCFEL